MRTLCNVNSPIRLTLRTSSDRYKSIRIDTVHYCPREAILSDLRKRGSFFDRNVDPEDPAAARLKLLCRTLREDPVRLGRRVEFLKTPYMLREAAQADLARTIAVLPNLRYVDLPEGMYTDEHSYLTLRLEVQARCREIRKMTYMHGSERSLQQLATGTVWTKLEVLELINIDMDPALLRQVLGALANLRAMKVSDTETFTDEMFYWSDMVPPFPVLEEFILREVPNVTAEGFKQWLAIPEVQNQLKVLSLNHTGIKAFTLHHVLALAPALKNLSIEDHVAASLLSAAGASNVPALASRSLEVLHFEITSSNSLSAASATASYYNYLASSLLSGGLPNLRAVYVRDQNFPDTLLGLPPPMPGFAEGGYARPASSGSSNAFSSRPPSSPGLQPISPHVSLSQGHLSLKQGQQNPYHTRFPSKQSNTFLQPQQQAPSNPRFSSNNPFANHAQRDVANLPAKLEVFTKSGDELVWSFYGPLSTTTRDKSPQRPLSSYGLGNDILGGSAAGWSAGAGARRSVLIGGAGGQFLQVPDADACARGRQHRKAGSADGGAGAPRSTFGFGVGGEEEEGNRIWLRPKSSAGRKKCDDIDLWR